MLTITAISASIMGLIFFKLVMNISKIRQATGIGLGDGGNEELLRAIRAQANLIEGGPLGLILIACLELNGASIILTAVLAAVLVIGRILHPMGMKNPDLWFRPRFVGTLMTFLSLLALSITNLVVVGMQLI